MPTYEYRCPEGHQFEHFFRKISDAEATMVCPVCGKLATRIVSGGAGLVFKGSGFYITDYGKDGKKDRKRAAPKPEAEAGSKDKGASDSGSESGGAAKKADAPAPDSPGSSGEPQPPPAAKPTGGSSGSGSTE